MDLVAYANIEDLEQLAKDNGIDIPRLRGYRLMSEEEPVSQEKINRMKKDCEVDVAKYLCCSDPFWNPNPSRGWEFSVRTDHLCDYYLTKDEIRWDRIHGWKRKILKFAIKKKKRRI